MIKIRFRPFGVLRKYQDQCESFELEVPEAIVVSDVKASLKSYLRAQIPGFLDDLLVDDAAIATDAQVLGPNHRITQSCCLLVLPPVCGG